MDKYKEIANDPAKLEAKIKEVWAKIDAKGEGLIPHAQFEAISRKLAEEANFPKVPEPSAEEKEKIKKLVDPNNTGKITFEGFKMLVQAGIAKGKKEGKI